MTESVSLKCFVLAVYQFRKGISVGPALKYLTWFIGAGGESAVFFCVFFVCLEILFQVIGETVKISSQRLGTPLECLTAKHSCGAPTRSSAMGLENILTVAEAVGWVWGCMIIALLASVLSFVSMLLFAFVFALMEVSLPLLSTSTITALVLMCAYSHHFFLVALGYVILLVAELKQFQLDCIWWEYLLCFDRFALPHGMLLLYNHQRLNNRRLHRSQVYVTVLLLQQIMGQLVPLVQGSDGSVPKPHLSQVCLSGSLSEGKKRHDNVWIHPLIDFAFSTSKEIV